MMRPQIKKTFWALLVFGLVHVALGLSATHAQQAPASVQRSPTTAGQPSSATHAQQAPASVQPSTPTVGQPSPTAVGQPSATPTSQPTSTPAEQAPANAQASTSIKIGAGDLLEITVF